MTLQYPYLLLLLPLTVWWLARQLRHSEQAPLSAWAFLLPQTNAATSSSPEQQRLAWAPFLLALAACTLLILLLARPLRPTIPVLWLSDPEILALQDDATLTHWLENATDLLKPSAYRTREIWTAHGKCSWPQNPKALRLWLQAQHGGPPSPAFLHQQGPRLVSAREDLYPDMPYLNCQKSGTLSISSVRQFQGRDMLITLQHQGPQGTPLPFTLWSQDRQLAAGELVDQPCLSLRLPDIASAHLQLKSTTQPTFHAAWTLRPSVQLHWRADVSLPQRLKPLLNSASAPVAEPNTLLITNNATAFLQHAGPAWLYLPQLHTMNGLSIAPASLPLSASTTSLLSLPTRHLMFDYPLLALPDLVIDADVGAPLLMLGSHPVLSRLTGKFTKIVQTLPFTAFQFEHAEQEEGLYKLCLSALGLWDLEGEEVFSHTPPTSDMRRVAARVSARLDLPGGMMAIGLMMSVLLFGLALTICAPRRAII